MKIVKADAKGRVTGFTPGQIYSVVDEEPREEWVRAHPEEVTGSNVGQAVGLVLGDGITLWGVLKMFQREGSGEIFILDGKDHGYSSRDSTVRRVTHVWVRQ